MTMTPTVADLDRYIELLSESSVDPEDAIDLIWPEPEQIDPPAPKAITQMVTEFPDGVVIGWDTCAGLNGGCGKHVSKCKCKAGPKEPAIFAKWREESSHPGQGALTVASTLPKPATTPVVAETAAVAAPVTPANSVPCREGKHFVSIDEADRNDDETYTCHACQEAGVQLERPQVDG